MAPGFRLRAEQDDEVALPDDVEREKPRSLRRFVAENLPDDRPFGLVDEPPGFEDGERFLVLLRRFFTVLSSSASLADRGGDIGLFDVELADKLPDDPVFQSVIPESPAAADELEAEIAPGCAPIS